MYYEPYGPYLPRPYMKNAARDWKGKFWREVEDQWEGLSTAVGVYVFSLRFGSKFTPWYVGKTCSELGFRGEVFQGHKLEHYYEAANGRRGEPCLHLIARVEANRGNFCRYSYRADDEIDRLETYLMAWRWLPTQTSEMTGRQNFTVRSTSQG